jgi:hypothetical protein
MTVLTLTGRHEYEVKESNWVSQVYIVDAITPVSTVNCKKIPYAGRKPVSAERKNQISARGMIKEKIV